MIIKIEIINQPYSGTYREKIYDNVSAWNSQNWSYIKFTNENFEEWCGVFRGFPNEVKISEKLNLILVLTSDYLYELEIQSGNLLRLIEHSGYNIMTVAPTGEFILGYYYYLAKVENNITEILKIESPIEMDMIAFKNWEGNILHFTCDEFTNWSRHLEMILDSKTWKISILNG